MKIDRRFLIRSVLAFSASLAFPRILFAARPDKAFESTDADAVYAELFGDTPTASDRVTMKIPDIAENGAVVPVTVSTDLENVESISVVVLNNPTPLAAAFSLGPRSQPKISVRIKMGQSSIVRAIVKADGKLFSTEKEVKVTIGGCGG
jgi:sulfur-oxidizing protein SoxY